MTSIGLSSNIYKHLQKQAKSENRSVNNYIETLLLENSEYFKPNEKTIATVKEAEEMRKNRALSKEIGENFCVFSNFR